MIEGTQSPVPTPVAQRSVMPRSLTACAAKLEVMASTQTLTATLLRRAPQTDERLVSMRKEVRYSEFSPRRSSAFRETDGHHLPWPVTARTGWPNADFRAAPVSHPRDPRSGLLATAAKIATISFSAAAADL